MVFSLSYVTFAAIKATIGIRVSLEEEEAGLDIAAHGMYGYPEQFIPQSEMGAPAMPVAPPASAPVAPSVRTGEATA
jgi:ammonium transporter, Amt family